MTVADHKRPRLAIGALGGTISMAAQPGEAGIVPVVDALTWAHRLPALAQLAQLSPHTLCLLPSASLGFDDVLAALHWARGQVREGAAGVVLTQGTDTLEETAYLLSLLWGEAAPLVLTGAMRGANHGANDGGRNLIDAAQVALAPESRGRGVQLVMNRRIHCPREVRKVHTLTVDAFASANTGPVGNLKAGQVLYQRRCTLPPPLRLCRVDQRVALVEASLGEGPELLEHACNGSYEGLVIAAFGAGHVPASWVPALELAARFIPVVVASRTGAGSTAFDTYGFPGGEIDLQRRSMHMAGTLCPRKCRLLLWALVGAEALEQLPSRLEQE